MSAGHTVTAGVGPLRQYPNTWSRLVEIKADLDTARHVPLVLGNTWSRYPDCVLLWMFLRGAGQHTAEAEQSERASLLARLQSKGLRVVGL